MWRRSPASGSEEAVLTRGAKTNLFPTQNMLRAEVVRTKALASTDVLSILVFNAMAAPQDENRAEQTDFQEATCSESECGKPLNTPVRVAHRAMFGIICSAITLQYSGHQLRCIRLTLIFPVESTGAGVGRPMAP